MPRGTVHSTSTSTSMIIVLKQSRQAKGIHDNLDLVRLGLSQTPRYMVAFEYSTLSLRSKPLGLAVSDYTRAFAPSLENDLVRSRRALASHRASMRHSCLMCQPRLPRGIKLKVLDFAL